MIPSILYQRGDFIGKHGAAAKTFERPKIEAWPEAVKFSNAFIDLLLPFLRRPRPISALKSRDRPTVAMNALANLLIASRGRALALFALAAHFSCAASNMRSMRSLFAAQHA